MRIDAHVHLCVARYGLEETLARIRRGLAEDGFDRAVLLPDFEEPNNEDISFAMRKMPGLFYGIFILDFGRSAKDLRNEFDSLLSSGFKGIKLHPRFQSIDLKREAEQTILAACNEKKLPVIIDGFMRQNEEGSRQMDFIRQAVDMLPRAKVVIAHFGALKYREALELAVKHKNVYIDLSSSLLFFLSTLPDTVKDMCRLVKDCNGEKFLHGSDYPIFEIGTYAQQAESFLKKAGLTEKELGWVFGDTAQSVFG